MNDYCSRFHFALDMNGDSAFTISDVELMLKFVWLLPAKLVVGFVHQNPQLTSFFEVTCSTGEGLGGAVFSLAGRLLPALARPIRMQSVSRDLLA